MGLGECHHESVRFLLNVNAVSMGTERSALGNIVHRLELLEYQFHDIQIEIAIAKKNIFLLAERNIQKQIIGETDTNYLSLILKEEENLNSPGQVLIKELKQSRSNFRSIRPIHKEESDLMDAMILLLDTYIQAERIQTLIILNIAERRNIES